MAANPYVTSLEKHVLARQATLKVATRVLGYNSPNSQCWELRVRAESEVVATCWLSAFTEHDASQMCRWETNCISY